MEFEMSLKNNCQCVDSSTLFKTPMNILSRSYNCTKHGTFRFCNCTYCNQLHVKICHCPTISKEFINPPYFRQIYRALYYTKIDRQLFLSDRCFKQQTDKQMV